MELVNNSNGNGKKLQQIALNVNGQPQMIVLPEGLDVKTLADIKPYIKQYLPQDISKYNLIIAETQTQLVTDSAALPVDKARLVIDVDSTTKETKFTLGLYAIPIMSKAGSTFTRNELVGKVKAIITEKGQSAKDYFTVDGKQYNMLKTEVLLDLYTKFEATTAKPKATKKVKPEIVAVVESVKAAKTKKAESVKVEVKPKAKKAKSIIPTKTEIANEVAVNVPFTTENIEAPQLFTLVGNTKTQLLTALDSVEAVFNSVRSIIESLPDMVVEEVTTKSAIEETVYTFNEYLESLRQNYYSVCKAIPNSRC